MIEGFQNSWSEAKVIKKGKGNSFYEELSGSSTGSSSSGTITALQIRVSTSLVAGAAYAAVPPEQRDVLTAESFPMLATRNSEWSRVGLPAECRRFHKHAYSFDCAHFGHHSKSGAH